MAKSKRRTNGAVRFLFLLLIVVAAFVGWDYFRVARVSVVGGDEAMSARVQELANIPLGENMLRLSLEQVEERVETDAYIRVLSVRRAWPDTIEIAVQKRSVFAAAEYNGGYVLLAEDNHVLEVTDLLIDMQLPIYRGLNLVSPEEGKPLQNERVYELAILQEVVNALVAHELFERVQAVDVSQTEAVRLVLTNRTQVNLGDRNELENKLRWMTAALEKMDAEGLFGILDVSSGQAAALQILPFGPLEAVDPGLVG